MATISSREQVPMSIRSLFGFTTRSHAPSLIAAIIFTIIAAVIKPAGAIFFGKIFSSLTAFAEGSIDAHSALHDISNWCIGLGVLGGALWLFLGLFLSSWMVFGELQAMNIREQMFVSMIDKDIEWYDLLDDGISSFTVRIQTQLRELQLAVSQPLGFLLYELVSSIAAIGVAFYFSWKLTFVIIATAPVACIALYFISIRLTPAIEAQNEELAKASKLTSSAISAIDTVKAFNGQEQEVWGYDTIIQRARGSYLTQALLSALQLGIMKFIVILLFVQGFWYGLVLVAQGTDPGHILTAFYACLNAMQAVEVILPQWLVLAKGISAGHALESIVHKAHTKRKHHTDSDLRVPSRCHGDIEFNDVSFSYPSNRSQLVLKKSSFFFPAGETTYIVGQSGSGKSTLANLIMRYYEPLEGEILLDGHPIASLDIAWLHKNVTLVQQHSVVFNESILQNIAFGKLGATRGEIRKSCKAAELEETLDALPEGINTLIGSKGKMMSGGQNQRICIARAQLRDSSILILDEATSALDRENKDKVISTIRKWRQNETTIIITHDLSTILDDEYVYIMESGVVTQEGYKRNLSKKSSGLFSKSNRSPDHGELMDPASLSNDNTERPSGDIPRRSNRFRRYLAVQDTISSRNLSFESERMFSPRIPSNYNIVANTILTNTRISSEEYNNLERNGKQPNHSSRSVSLDKVVSGAGNNIQTGSVSREGNVQDDEHHTMPLESLPTRETSNKTAPEQKPATLWKIFCTVWPTLAWKDRTFFVGGFVTAIIVAAATPLFSFVFANLLNVFNLHENRGAESRKWALILLAVAFMDGLASFCSRYCLERSGDAWVNAMRVEALRRILSQPKCWFDSYTGNYLSECLDRNAEEMRNFIGRFAGNCFTALWILCITLVWALIISWKLTLVTLACGPVIFIITRAFNWASVKWEDKCNHASDDASNIFTEAFLNIKAVRALTLEAYFEDKHKRATINAYKIGLSRAGYCGLLFGCTNMISFCVAGLVFYYGTVIVTSGQRNVQQIFSVMNLLLFGISNASAMLYLVPQINSSRVTATSLIRLANLPLLSHEAHGTERLTSLFPIHIKSLCFAYPSHPQVLTLDNVSMKFDAGSCTAIVGPSGSGKSTVTSIIMGLYQLQPINHPLHLLPSLTFATSPIESIHTASLRSLMAIVPQNPVLFPTTIAANITYGLAETSPYNNPRAIAVAAQEAGIHDFIESLPEGYGTLIGEGGQGLSGGQTQRLAIARALIRRPQLLVLDEPTSALDNESAEAIRKTIRQYMISDKARGFAVVIITHDVEMMKVADRVVYLKSGRVVECGAFEELIAKSGGVFATLLGEIGSMGPPNGEPSAKNEDTVSGADGLKHRS
ncbi:ABC transporter-like protein [Xylogone sp. PMI_703]|nr:ABC transporter-like protein [Xylogone sp. PMI_703]